MIGVSFSEIIIILIVMLLIINPKDIPSIVKYLKKVKSKFDHLNSELYSVINKLSSESDSLSLNDNKDLNEINILLKEICDNGGKYDGEYDIEKIREAHKKIVKPHN